MTTKKNLAALALAVSVSAIATVSAQAQNPNYQDGDLVLFLQNPGGTAGSDQLLFVNLGNTANAFRGSASGIGGAVSSTLFNINTELSAAFGSGWASEVGTLRAGLAGVWGSDAVDTTTLQNGDPNRTIYTSRSRTAVGTLGSANSSGLTVSSNASMSSGSNNILGALNAFETGVGATLGIFQTDTNSSTLDDGTLPTPAPLGGDFGIFASPGVQQTNAAGTIGSFGGVSNIEFALDLYRILAVTTAPGQVSGGLRVGSYEGTVVLNTTGDVSFLGATAVPEPTSALLFGAVIGAAGLSRRRRQQA